MKSKFSVFIRLTFRKFSKQKTHSIEVGLKYFLEGLLIF